jgi:hypothetical protein
MKTVEWATAVLLIIMGAAWAGIGVAAGEQASYGWLAQLTAGFTTGIGIVVMVTVLVVVTRRARAR